MVSDHGLGRGQTMGCGVDPETGIFYGYRTVIARYLAKWGIAQMRLCETEY